MPGQFANGNVQCFSVEAYGSSLDGSLCLFDVLLWLAVIALLALIRSSGVADALGLSALLNDSIS